MQSSHPSSMKRGGVKEMKNAQTLAGMDHRAAAAAATVTTTATAEQ
jgi:hypothetical protein